MHLGQNLTRPKKVHLRTLSMVSERASFVAKTLCWHYYWTHGPSLLCVCGLEGGSVVVFCFEFWVNFRYYEQNGMMQSHYVYLVTYGAHQLLHHQKLFSLFLFSGLFVVFRFRLIWFYCSKKGLSFQWGAPLWSLVFFQEVVLYVFDFLTINS